LKKKNFNADYMKEIGSQCCFGASPDNLVVMEREIKRLEMV
jgi:hypothetical protein